MCDKILGVSAGHFKFMEASLNKLVVSENYKFERNVPSASDVMIAKNSMEDYLDPARPLDAEVFLAQAMACNFEMKVVDVKPSALISLPKSHSGKTTINYAGEAPLLALEPDEFGNLQIVMSANSVVEVIFNRELPNAQGKNRGAHGKKIIYVA